MEKATSSLLLIRSIPLSSRTRTALITSGIKIVTRKLARKYSAAVIATSLYGKALINFGNLECDFDNVPIPVFNMPESIRAISSPQALRRTLNDYIPANLTNDKHWHKRVGFGGNGKIYHEKIKDSCSREYGDIQQHIDGVEYRVISVGNSIVQAARKEPVIQNGYGISTNFNYNWIGVDGVRNNGIIPHIKKGIELIPNWSYTVFGWDIIIDKNDRVYTIEINTSPGVNEHTASRIVKEIEKVL